MDFLLLLMYARALFAESYQLKAAHNRFTSESFSVLTQKLCHLEVCHAGWFLVTATCYLLLQHSANSTFWNFSSRFTLYSDVANGLHHHHRHHQHRLLPRQGLLARTHCIAIVWPNSTTKNMANANNNKGSTLRIHKFKRIPFDLFYIIGLCSDSMFHWNLLKVCCYLGAVFITGGFNGFNLLDDHLAKRRISSFRRCIILLLNKLSNEFGGLLCNIIANGQLSHQIAFL